MHSGDKLPHNQCTYMYFHIHEFNNMHIAIIIAISLLGGPLVLFFGRLSLWAHSHTRILITLKWWINSSQDIGCQNLRTVHNTCMSAIVIEYDSTSSYVISGDGEGRHWIVGRRG